KKELHPCTARQNRSCRLFQDEAYFRNPLCPSPCERRRSWLTPGPSWKAPVFSSIPSSSSRQHAFNGTGATLRAASHQSIWLILHTADSTTRKSLSVRGGMQLLTSVGVGTPRALSPALSLAWGWVLPVCTGSLWSSAHIRNARARAGFPLPRTIGETS